MSRKSLKLFAAGGLVAAGLSAGLAPSAWAEAGGCIQPLSSGADPVASDCLYILRVAVGSITPPRPCITQPRGVATKAADALLCLQFSVGQPVSIDCPCSAPGQPDLESSATTFDPAVDITPDLGVPSVNGFSPTVFNNRDYNSTTPTGTDPFGIDDKAIRSRFVKTRFIGAISQDADPAKGDWTAGWSVEVHGNHTVWHPSTEGTLSGATPTATGTCPAGTIPNGTTTLPAPFTGSMDICQLPGRYNVDGGTLTLTNDNVYTLGGLGSGGTLIGDGDGAGKTEDEPLPNPPFTKAANSTLVIEPGTLILGDVQEALIITRGSKIFANGTKANPISMNSVTQWEGWKSNTDYTGLGVGTGARREWGGLVITGFGWTNTCVSNTVSCDQLVEGLAVNVAFGGHDENWNAGSVNYVEISNSGYDINGNGNDLNGITLYSLGAPTVISHVDINHAGDDSCEFFGGNVVVDHYIATGGLDDNLDSDVGFRGGAQFALLRQFPDDGDKGIEPDNGAQADPNANIIEPRSHPHYVNVTWMGQKTTAAQHGTSMSLRTGTGMLLANSALGGSRRVELRSEFRNPSEPANGSCDYAGPSGLNVVRIHNTWFNARSDNDKAAGGATFDKNFEGVSVSDYACTMGLVNGDASNHTADPGLNAFGFPNTAP